MKLFNKMSADKATDSANSSKKTAFKRKFKHGAYATAITCVFVAVIIAFNIGATVLAEKFPLSLDFTAKGDFTISDENKEYIKDINRNDLKIDIIVCATETEYTDGTISQSLLSQNIYDLSGGQYFTQNVYLLKEYVRLNKAISLKFINPSDPDFNVYASNENYQDEDFAEGDIIIESSFTLDGEKITRGRHLTMEDIFEVGVDQENETSYMYYYYYGYSSLVSNNIETAVTSAIYSLTSDKIYQVAYLTHNGGTDISNLEGLMEQNNYEFNEIKNLNEEEIPEDTDIIIIAQPSFDYSEEELEKIDLFLENDGKLGKNVLYIASARQPELPNINEFLSEWSFEVLSGTFVYETNSDNRANAFTIVTETENNYTGGLAAQDYAFYSATDVPVVMKKPNGSKEYTVLLQFSEDSIAANIDAETEEDAIENAVEKGPFAALAICTNAVWDGDINDYAKSSVMVCSSTDMITYGSISAKIGNIKAITNTLDKLVGKKTTDISFDSRTFATNQFETLPSDAASNTMKVIFVFLLPVSLLACGVIVAIRRRRA